MDSKEDIIGWIATVVSMYFYINPIIPFIKVFKKKLKYEDTPIISITINYVNCLCWFVYGDMIYSHPIKYCHLIGGIICLIFIATYLIYEIRQYLLDAILNALIIFTGSWAAYRAFTMIIDDDLIIGKICIGTSCICILYQILLIFKVCKKKNYTLINIYNIWIGIAINVLWIIYGIIIRDYHMYIPNIIGIGFYILQIVLYCYYKKKYPYPIMDEKSSTSTIVNESTISKINKNEETNNNQSNKIENQ